MKPKQLDWEKEFDDNFENCFEPNGLEMNIYKKWRSSSGTRERAVASIDDFKSFIQSLLFHQRQQLLKEIVEKNKDPMTGLYDYDGIAEEVINLVKK